MGSLLESFKERRSLIGRQDSENTPACIINYNDFQVLRNIVTPQCIAIVKEAQIACNQ